MWAGATAETDGAVLEGIELTGPGTDGVQEGLDRIVDGVTALSAAVRAARTETERGAALVAELVELIEPLLI